MKRIEEYVLCFTRLRRAPNYGGAPHKPVLLLSVLDAIERGFISSERIYISAELIALFKSNWSIWVRTPHVMNFTLPFYHLSNEPFWNLVAKEGVSMELTNKRSIKSFQALLRCVDYAVVDRDLFYYMCNKESRKVLRKAIIDKYFFNVRSNKLSDLSYLDSIAEQILRDSAVQYKKKINGLLENGDNDNFEEEVFLRNRVFKKKIPEIYDYTCSISGLSVRSTYSYSLMDACHIVPFSLEHDDTIGNGIALCPNLHRAFDSGLVTIDCDYRVVVSNKFIEEGCPPYSIRQFDNKKIILPNNKLFHPRREVLEWHNENVFERNL